MGVFYSLAGQFWASLAQDLGTRFGRVGAGLGGFFRPVRGAGPGVRPGRNDRCADRPRRPSGPASAERQRPEHRRFAKHCCNPRQPELRSPASSLRLYRRARGAQLKNKCRKPSPIRAPSREASVGDADKATTLLGRNRRFQRQSFRAPNASRRSPPKPGAIPLTVDPEQRRRCRKPWLTTNRSPASSSASVTTDRVAQLKKKTLVSPSPDCLQALPPMAFSAASRTRTREGPRGLEEFWGFWRVPAFRHGVGESLQMYNDPQPGGCEGVERQLIDGGVCEL
jgi:hypothetical protein